ncbi:MAG: amidohydrolase family protein, partial [Acidobacteriia bacterium]|nr:amidohydrolase family protein [Terriglobia bacterium]
MTAYLRIATEEAFAPPEILDRYRTLIAEEPDLDPGFTSLMGFYLGPSPRATQVMSRMPDLDAIRLRDMDETGIARQIVSLTSPGVQIFDRDTAAALAELSNDYLAEGIRKHPDRFDGLAAIAPQDPAGAAKELERGV